jgi:mono/diheme cytochrome c family protein
MFLVLMSFGLLGGGIFLTGAPKTLQAGNGKQILQSRCTICHDAGRIERAKFDLDGWKETVRRMEGKNGFGPMFSDAERQMLLDYLVSR